MFIGVLWHNGAFDRSSRRKSKSKTHWSSSLLPSQPAPENTPANPLPGSNQIVYILDQDLIRFAKFAGAVLALVIAVGVILYGIDIKQAAKEAEESAKEVRKEADSMRDLRREAMMTKEDIQKMKDAVAVDRLETEKQLGSVQEKLRTIQTTEENTRNK